MPNPWEYESGLEMPSGTSLLDSEFPLRLSEFDVRPESQWQYFFGSLLAGIHGQNYRYVDFHPGNVGLDPRNGQFAIMDEGGTVPTKLHPREMAADLLIPCQTLAHDDLNAFIAGYIRRAYCELDLKYEGYTRAILNEIGGQIISTPAPGPPVLGFADVLRRLSLTINEDLTLTFKGAPDPSQLDYAQLDDYLLVVFLLYISGASVQPLEQVREFLREHLPDDWDIKVKWFAFTQFFSYLALQRAGIDCVSRPERCMPTVEETMSTIIGGDGIARPEGCVANNIISWLITECFSKSYDFAQYVAPGSGEWLPNWALLSVLQPRPQGFAPLEYVHLIDKMIAFACQFAKRMDEDHCASADRVTKNRSSSFTQFAVEVLANSPGHPRWDEIRYVRLMAAFNNLSWKDECSVDQLKASDRVELFNYIRLAHSFLSLELDLFKNSVMQVRNQGSGNPLWSLAWNALCRAREMLYATEPLLEEGQGLIVIPEDVHKHLELALADYERALSYIVQSSSALLSPFISCLVDKDEDGVKKGSFLRELDWVKGAGELLQSVPPASFPTFIASIRAGREFFVTNARVFKQRQS